MLEDIQTTIKQIQQDILNNHSESIQPHEYKELLLRLISLEDKDLSKRCIIIFLLTFNPLNDLPDEASEFFNTIVTTIKPQQFTAIYQTILRIKHELEEQKVVTAPSLIGSVLQKCQSLFYSNPPIEPTSTNNVQKCLASIERIKLKVSKFSNENSSLSVGFTNTIFQENQPLIIALLLESYLAKERRILQEKDLYEFDLFIAHQLEAPNRASIYNILLDDLQDYKEIIAQFDQNVSQVLKPSELAIKNSGQYPSLGNASKQPLSSTSVERAHFQQHLNSIIDTKLREKSVISSNVAPPSSQHHIKLKNVEHVGVEGTMQQLFEPVKHDRTALLSMLRELEVALLKAHKNRNPNFSYQIILKEIYDLFNTADDEVLKPHEKQKLTAYLDQLICQLCLKYVLEIADIHAEDSTRLTGLQNQLNIFINFYIDAFKTTEPLSTHIKNQISLLKNNAGIASQIKNTQFDSFTSSLSKQLDLKESLNEELLQTFEIPSKPSSVIRRRAFSEAPKGSADGTSGQSFTLPQSTLGISEQPQVMSNSDELLRQTVSVKRMVQSLSTSTPSFPVVPAEPATTQTSHEARPNVQQHKLRIESMTTIKQPLASTLGVPKPDSKQKQTSQQLQQQAKLIEHTLFNRKQKGEQAEISNTTQPAQNSGANKKETTAQSSQARSRKLT